MLTAQDAHKTAMKFASKQLMNLIESKINIRSRDGNFECDVDVSNHDEFAIQKVKKDLLEFGYSVTVSKHIDNCSNTSKELYISWRNV